MQAAARPVTLASACAVGILLAGCAANPPLFFADNVSFGLQIGADTAGAGAGVSLGFTNHSLAVVPVSVLDQTGTAFALRGKNEPVKDALSVFAAFKSTADSTTSPIKVGQMFATGTAAQLLTEGLKCNLSGMPCANPPVVAASGPALAPSTAASAAEAAIRSATLALNEATEKLHAESEAAAKRLAQLPATDRPYQRPLVYSRSDVWGFEIAGSTAEQGTAFTLGYSTRNIALVPVYARHAGDAASNLFGGDGAKASDAYSVLGQFSANTQTKSLSYGLERYFATGVAAQNLASGLRIALAASSPASGAGK